MDPAAAKAGPLLLPKMQEVSVAQIIEMDEIADCDSCKEVSKRVIARTIDLDGPGKVGKLYDCDNKYCKKKRGISLSYIIRKEIANREG